MQRVLIVFVIILLSQLVAVGGLSQSDKLVGRWEGKLIAPQGEVPATATFKKEGDKYTGTITGQRGDLQLKEIKVEGDKITAKADIETGQGALTINYAFTLQGDVLKGVGSLDFGGTPYSFDVDLKRAAAGAAATPEAAPAQPQRQRSNVPQPQQKQTIDYFVGQWTFRYVGRESALGIAPREGVITFTKRADGKTLDAVTQGKHDGGAFKETAVIIYDEASKQLTFAEKLANGVQLNSRGDWNSPISIRFTVEPVKTKNQTVQLKRTISVVAAHSFTVTEELSEDGGAFVRLGTAIYSRVEAK